MPTPSWTCWSSRDGSRRSGVGVRAVALQFLDRVEEAVELDLVIFLFDRIERPLRDRQQGGIVRMARLGQAQLRLDLHLKLEVLAVRRAHLSSKVARVRAGCHAVAVLASQ